MGFQRIGHINQKVVTVMKELTDTDHIYACINIEALENAAADLDAGAFKMWIYFAKNQDCYQFALSSKDARERFGVKIKQYNNAIETLQEKGYLVQDDENDNTWIFYETPIKIPANDND